MHKKSHYLCVKTNWCIEDNKDSGTKSTNTTGDLLFSPILLSTTFLRQLLPFVYDGCILPKLLLTQCG